MIYIYCHPSEVRSTRQLVNQSKSIKPHLISSDPDAFRGVSGTIFYTETATTNAKDFEYLEWLTLYHVTLTEFDQGVYTKLGRLLESM